MLGTQPCQHDFDNNAARPVFFCQQVSVSAQPRAVTSHPTQHNTLHFAKSWHKQAKPTPKGQRVADRVSGGSVLEVITDIGMIQHVWFCNFIGNQACV